jgi:FkbM family methyltransferase
MNSVGLPILKKIQLFSRSTSILKNWYNLPTIYFKWINKEFATLETKNGLKIKLRVNSTDFMQFTTVWLQKEYEKSGFEIKSNDIIIDVGAHIGLFTLFASQKCKDGKIYAFEPVRENYEILLSNITTNNLSNVISFNAAVTNKDGFAKIYLSKDDAGHSTMSATEISVDVKSKSLNTFLESEIEKCNFLKLDCEGAEYEIIESLTNGSLKKIDKMCIEYHNAIKQQNSFNNLLSKLKNSSYQVTVKPISENIGMIYAKK